MERVACDVERLHLGIADLDALLVGPRVERTLDFQAGLGRRRGDQFDDGQSVRQGPAAPSLRVMWQNRRCSILFHFDVPGG